MTSRPVFSLTLDRVGRTLASADRRFDLDVTDFRVRAGEVVAVTGKSGSGKSTFLELLCLAAMPDRAVRFDLETPDGPVDLSRQRLRHGRLAALRRRHLGFVLQNGGLLPFLGVADNIALPQRLAGRPDPGFLQELMEALDLAPLRRALPRALSIGQRQRVAIARALAHRPALVVADEPTAALDPMNRDRVTKLFLDLSRLLGTAVVIATHDRTVAAGANMRHAPIRLVESEAEGVVRARLSMAAG